VYRVLLRLLAPRHPPYALSSLSRDAEKLKFLHSIQLLKCCRIDYLLLNDCVADDYGPNEPQSSTPQSYRDENSLTHSQAANS
jgi:hypothetical protein